MADSTREAALKRLFALIDGAGTGATVRRNEPEESRIPDSGLIDLRDGDPGEPDGIIGSGWAYEHEADGRLVFRR